MLFALLPLVSCSPISRIENIQPELVNKVHVPNAAFVDVFKDNNGASSVYLSSFSGNPFANHDGTYFTTISNPFELPKSLEKIGGNIVWPNKITQVPKSLFGTDGVVAASGFLVPGKTNGGIYFSSRDENGQQADWVPLFKAKNHFYHQITFYDVDKDGQLDILTCRATTSLFGGSGDLVYLVPEDRENPTGKWIETVLNSFCDTFFEIADLNGDGHDEIIAAVFWTNKLTVTRSNHPQGSFADPSYLETIIVEKNIGHLFGIEILDLNLDGKLDILVTNHQGNKETPKSALMAYEVPSDLSKPWTKHILSEGFRVLQKGFKQAAPGAAIGFYPTPNKTVKPWIALAGDGSQKAYLIVPNSQDSSNWEYTTTVLHDCQATVGGIAVADTTGSGYADIFIPCYDKSELVVYTFNPSNY